MTPNLFLFNDKLENTQKIWATPSSARADEGIADIVGRQSLFFIVQ